MMRVVGYVEGVSQPLVVGIPRPPTDQSLIISIPMSSATGQSNKEADWKFEPGGIMSDHITIEDLYVLVDVQFVCSLPKVLPL